jgi:hypothetical protein
VSAQGSAHRGGSEVDEAFISLYNKEYLVKRILPTLEVTSKDDILRKELPALSLSLFKEFIEKHEIKLNDDEEEELIGDETDVLKFSQITDNGSDKVRHFLFRSTWCIPTATRSRRSSSKTGWRSRCSWARLWGRNF